MRTKYIMPIEKCDTSHMYIFKKSFSGIKNLSIRICAISRYRLYINDTLVCEGPCQGSEHENYYEEMDVTMFLNPNGKNEIKAEIMHISDNKFSTVATYEKPILWFEGTENGIIVIRTDTSWEISRIDGIELIQGDGVMFSVCPFERHNANKCKVLLSTIEGEAVSPDDPCISPYGFLGLLKLKKSPLPQMRTHTPIQLERIQNFDNGYVLDATSYTTARIRLRICGHKGDILRIKYSECYIKSGELWNSEDGEQSSMVKGLRDDTSGKLIGPSDYIELSGEQQDIEFFYYRAFRFMELSCEHINELEIEVFCSPYFYPFDISAEFHCSDERYNQMWDISIRTLLCCSHEILVDCPFYEQQQYAMDSYLEAMYALKICNDTRLPEKVISDMAQSQQANGLLCANYPSRYVQIIPTFSIYWIMLVHDYYLYSGNKELVRRYMGTIHKILSAFEELIDNNGLVKSAYWPYVDWAGNWVRGIPNGGCDNPIAVYSMQYSAGLKCAELLASEAEYAGLAQDYKNIRKSLNMSICLSPFILSFWYEKKT